MPASLKMQQEFGDDLAVIFVESQGADVATMESFTLGRKWLGGLGMWTTERPVSVAGSGLPKMALLSNDGEVLLTGNPLSLHGEMEDAIVAEIDRANAPPEGTPSSLKKTYKLLGQRKYGKALTEARKVMAKGGEDVGAAEVAVTSVQARVDALFARVEWQLENGYYVEAEATLDRIEDGVAGDDASEGRVDQLVARLESDELEDERDAAKALARIQEKLFEEGPDEKLERNLEKLAEKHAGTRAAERAQRLAELSRKA